MDYFVYVRLQIYVYMHNVQLHIVGGYIYNVCELVIYEYMFKIELKQFVILKLVYIKLVEIN